MDYSKFPKRLCKVTGNDVHCVVVYDYDMTENLAVYVIEEIAVFVYGAEGQVYNHLYIYYGENIWKVRHGVILDCIDYSPEYHAAFRCVVNEILMKTPTTL